MNAATVQVLDEMVLGAHAKTVLGTLVMADQAPVLVALFKRLGGSKMLDEFESKIGEALGAEMNLVRYALACCEVPLCRQEELVRQTVRRISTIFVGYVDKISRGEPIDEEHAEHNRRLEKLEAAETPADKLRALADMLDPKPAAGKFSA